MKKLLGLCFKAVKILLIVIGVLFVVYFWNLDMKLMGWLYKKVNILFDRKEHDIQF
ncbi:MAG: hypothetical protein IJ771_03935 [Clostridia bacterium]|nr:hypothetical protein [Clostridia bacterium]MEE1291996.1 hypothetical protein [Acutalibacteraceae bacterium]